MLGVGSSSPSPSPSISATPCAVRERPLSWVGCDTNSVCILESRRLPPACDVCRRAAVSGQVPPLEPDALGWAPPLLGVLLPAVELLARRRQAPLSDLRCVVSGSVALEAGAGAGLGQQGWRVVSGICILCFWYGGCELLPQGCCGRYLPPVRSTVGAGSSTGSSHPLSALLPRDPRTTPSPTPLRRVLAILAALCAELTTMALQHQPDALGEPAQHRIAAAVCSSLQHATESAVRLASGAAGGLVPALEQPAPPGDLLAGLDALAAAAERLLGGSRVFAQMCAADDWVVGLLARGALDGLSLSEGGAASARSLGRFASAAMVARRAV